MQSRSRKIESIELDIEGNVLKLECTPFLPTVTRHGFSAGMSKSTWHYTSMEINAHLEQVQITEGAEWFGGLYTKCASVKGDLLGHLQKLLGVDDFTLEMVSMSLPEEGAIELEVSIHKA